MAEFVTKKPIFNIKGLFVDNLILGNIIGHKKISFVNKEIEYAALEKAMQLFKNIPALGQSRESISSRIEPTITEIPSLAEDKGHTTIIKNSEGVEVAYVESKDEMIKGGELNENPVEKIIEKYEESNYNPKLFIRTFIDTKTEVTELENIEYMIQKKQILLQEWMNHNEKHFTDKVNKEKQIIKTLHKQIVMLEDEISTYKRKAETNKIQSVEKLLEKYTQNLNDHEKRLSSEEYAKKYHKISKKTYDELNEIINTIHHKINDMEKTENLGNAEKIVEIIKKMDSDSLVIFINNNESYITNVVYNEEQLRELIPIIRKLTDENKINRKVLDKMMIFVNKF